MGCRLRKPNAGKDSTHMPRTTPMNKSAPSSGNSIHQEISLNKNPPATGKRMAPRREAGPMCLFPWKPAMPPRKTPRIIEIPTATNPTAMAIFDPSNMRAKTSRPSSSVPNG